MAEIGVTYSSLVGLILKLHRGARSGATQTLAAKALGVAHHSTVVRLEQGDGCVNVEQLALLARFFGTSPAELLSDADKLASVLCWAGVHVLPARAGLLQRSASDVCEVFEGDMFQLFLDVEPRTNTGDFIFRHRLAPLERIRAAYQALPPNAKRWHV